MPTRQETIEHSYCPTLPSGELQHTVRSSRYAAIAPTFKKKVRYDHTKSCKTVPF